MGLPREKAMMVLLRWKVLLQPKGVKVLQCMKAPPLQAFKLCQYIVVEPNEISPW